MVKPRATTKPKPTPVKPAPVKPAPVALAAPVAVDAPAPVLVDAPAPAPTPVVDTNVDAPANAIIGDDSAPLLPLDQKPMTESELVLMYQRVGRDIQLLQNDRGTDKVLDLWPMFRAIKLKEMCKTLEGRLNLEGTLKQLRSHIDRRRGITISADCLNNPLSANCQ